MIYRSNLKVPDLQPCFRHVICRPMPQSFGHDVLSDRDHQPECGFWTHDEAAILYSIAERMGGAWADIGGHTGWTACHVAEAGCQVTAVDKLYLNPDGRARTEENIAAAGLSSSIALFAGISREFFASAEQRFDGVSIDGDHDAPAPLDDARDALAHLKPQGVILLHDFIGEPVRQAVRFLLTQGLRCRVYLTPHLVAACWCGDLQMPTHEPDPAVRAQIMPQCIEFHRYV